MNKFYEEEYATPLSELDYKFLEQNLSLKGLLKPFKGKGELEQPLQEIENTISQLEQISERLIEDNKERLPIKYLPFYLKKRRLKNGSIYLSWKQIKIVIEQGKTKRMEIEGKKLIYDALKHKTLSLKDKNFIREIEKDRLTINFQMRVCIRVRQLIKEMLPKYEELDRND
ncbi:MAG: DUF3158 family protein [Gilliamella apicola]|nr:DUF3158 family protein [Gilliamella apicola]